MAYVITSQCECCGSCEEICPSGAIYHIEDDPDWPAYYIYPDKCTECGICEEDCDIEAILLDDEVPEKYIDDIQKNIEFFDSGPGERLIEVGLI